MWQDQRTSDRLTRRSSASVLDSNAARTTVGFCVNRSRRRDKSMTETGRAAAFYGPGNSFRINEYQLPDPEPGAILLKTSVANVCGSDLHQWRGEFDLAAFGRPYPQILGHEMAATVHRLGEGVTRDTAGEDLHEGDRVVFRYFHPCGRCRACLKRVFRACPFARSYLTRSCDESPHFYGAFGEF